MLWLKHQLQKPIKYKLYVLLNNWKLGMKPGKLRNAYKIHHQYKSCTVFSYVSYIIFLKFIFHFFLNLTKGTWITCRHFELFFSSFEKLQFLVTELPFCPKQANINIYLAKNITATERTYSFEHHVIHILFTCELVYWNLCYK